MSNVSPARPLAAKPLWWIGYILAVVGTVTAIVVVIRIGFQGKLIMSEDQTRILNGGWVLLLSALNVLLTSLILLPIGLACYRKGQSATSVAFILFLAFLAPNALVIVFFSACGAAFLVMGGRKQ